MNFNQSSRHYELYAIILNKTGNNIIIAFYCIFSRGLPLSFVTYDIYPVPPVHDARKRDGKQALQGCVGF